MKRTHKLLLVLLTLALLVGAFAVMAMASDGGKEAKIGDTEYATLAEALAAAQADDVVTLLGDTTLSAAVTATTSYTLDLAGHDLILSAALQVKSGATLTLQNSGTTGMIQLYAGGQLFADGANLTLKNVAVNATYHSGAAVTVSNGTAEAPTALTLNGAKIYTNAAYALQMTGNITCTVDNSELRQLRTTVNNQTNKHPLVVVASADATGSITMTNTVLEYYWRCIVNDYVSTAADNKVAVSLTDCDIYAVGSSEDGFNFSRAMDISISGGTFNFTNQIDVSSAGVDNGNYGNPFHYSLGGFQAVVTFDADHPTATRFSYPLNVEYIKENQSIALITQGLIDKDGQLWYDDNGSGYSYLYATAEHIAACGLAETARLCPYTLRSRGDFNYGVVKYASWYGEGGVQNPSVSSGALRSYDGVMFNTSSKWGNVAMHTYTDANGFENTYACFYSDRTGTMEKSGESDSVLWNGSSYGGTDAYIEASYGTGGGSTKYSGLDYEYYVASFDLFTESSFIPAFNINVQTRRGEDGASKGPGSAVASIEARRQADGSLTLTVKENGAAVATKNYKLEAYETLRFTFVVHADLAADVSEDKYGTFNDSTSKCMIYVNDQPLIESPIKWVGVGGGQTVNILDGIRIAMQPADLVTKGDNLCIDNVCTTAYARTTGENTLDSKATLASLFTDPTQVLTGLGIFGTDAYYAMDGGYRGMTHYLPTGNPIAKIGDTSYTSLAAALAAAGEGDTITLLRDVKFPATVQQKVKIDTAGYTFSSTTDSYGYLTEGNVYSYADYDDIDVEFWFEEDEKASATIKANVNAPVSYPNTTDSRLSSTYVEREGNKWLERKFVGWSTEDFDADDATTSFIVTQDIYNAALEDEGIVYLYACYEETEITPSYIVYEEDAENLGTYSMVALYVETDFARYPVFKTVVTGLTNGQYVKLNIDIKYEAGYAPGIYLNYEASFITVGIDLNGHELRMDSKGVLIYLQNKHRCNIFSSQPGGLLNGRSLESADTNNYNTAGALFYTEAHGRWYFGSFVGSLLKPDNGTRQYGDNITFRAGVLVEVRRQWSTSCRVILDGGIYDACVSDSWGFLMARNSCHPNGTDTSAAQITIQNAKIYVTEATGGRALFGFPDATASRLDIVVRDSELWYTKPCTRLLNYSDAADNIKITFENVVGNYVFNVAATNSANVTIGAGNVFAGIDNAAKYTFKSGVTVAAYNGDANATFTHRNAYEGNRTDGYDLTDVTETWTGRILTCKTVSAADTVTVTYTDLAGATQTATLARGGNFVGTLDDATVGLVKRHFTGWSGTTENLQEDTTLTPTYTVSANLTGMKQNLSLYSSFSVNLYVPVSSAITSINGTLAAELRTVTIDGTQYYVATAAQDASAAGDDLTFTVVVTQGDDSATQTVTLSCVRYAQALQNSEIVTQVDKTFLAYMLTYVKAAYTYFGKAEQLPETVDTILAANAELMTGTLEPATPVNTIDAEIFKGATLDLTAAPSFRFYLNEGFDGAVRFTYTNYKGATVTVEKAVTAADDCVALSEMRAYDFAATVTVEVKVGDGEYAAAGQYNLAAYEPSENVEATNALVEALNYYIAVANAYKQYMDAGRA